MFFCIKKFCLFPVFRCRKFARKKSRLFLSVLEAATLLVGPVQLFVNIWLNQKVWCIYFLVESHTVLSIVYWNFFHRLCWIFLWQPVAILYKNSRYFVSDSGKFVNLCVRAFSKIPVWGSSMDKMWLWFYLHQYLHSNALYAPWSCKSAVQILLVTVYTTCFAFLRHSGSPLFWNFWKPGNVREFG